MEVADSPKAKHLRASVVIPAHNEASVIDRCLTHLSKADDLRIVVAANGCTDDTVSKARAHRVHVVEVPQASKVAALNTGDAVARPIMPRIYLDADIEVDLASMYAVIDALAEQPGAALAMPTLRYDFRESSGLVRAFFNIYLRLPYMRGGLGTGCYGLNAEGRNRWGAYPDVMADDLFVQGLFSHGERIAVPQATCVARPPRDVVSLIRVRTRSHLGARLASEAGLNGQMNSGSKATVKALLRLMRQDPNLLIPGLVYVAVTITARVRAARLRSGHGWLRDESSR